LYKAVSYTVFDTLRDIGTKTPIFHNPHPFNLHGRPEFLIECRSIILTQTVRVPALLGGAKILA